MKYNAILYNICILLAVVLASCDKKLDRNPINTTTAEDVFSTAEGTKQALAKVYGAFALTSSTATDASDIAGIDAGTSDFLRLFWMTQEAPTDEALCIWTSDPGVMDMDNITWTSSNVLLNGLYNRSIYQITVANSFLRETSSSTAVAEDTLAVYRAEARFLRAYQYWVLLDLFGNPPFLDENSTIGKEAPKQISRADLFDYVESELLAIQDQLLDAQTNEYGRADKAAAWALLARLYLNAAVYTGTEHYGDAITYATKVINSGYSLHTTYSHLFMADNNENNPETILSINYDGNYTQNYGGTTFIVNGAVNSSMSPSSFGIPGGGWGGLVARKPLPLLFGDDYTTSDDDRAMFYGTDYEITDESSFSNGIKVIKFTNKNSDGTTPTDASTFVSTDFPIFRLAEQYLIYAEATLRGGSGGSTSQALTYVNLLRSRANTTSLSTVSLNDILDERGRELYWECFRRSDLVRYGLFTTSGYLWPWKGGASTGTAVQSYFNLFPIPASDISANTNLTQNSGY
ncbi:MAG: RagB/SusD family nutrient uptake outer membrane protein [Niabella sp.]